MHELRRWIAICEAPIGDIYTHGDFSQPGSFRADDLTLSTPKRQDKIKRILQKAPVVIDLHFVNQEHRVDINWHLDPVHAQKWLGFLSAEQAEERWGVKLVPRPDAVNVVVLQNEGDNRVPMTPWIIAHRIAHMFNYTHKLSIDRLSQNFLNSLEQVQDEYKRGESRYRPQFYELAKVFGTTRACREGLITRGRTFEWLWDCFAQMCVIGTINFKPAPKEIVTTPFDEVYTIDDDMLSYVDSVFANLAEKLIDEFTILLNDCVGEIMVF